MHRRHALIIVLGIVSAVGPVSRARAADDVDTYVKAEMQRQKLPGLALVVLHDGKVQKSAGYGVADRDTHVEVTLKTLIKIGSVSKQFIATGVMLLVQDGKLGVDDPVRRYLPDAPETWNGITIRHLLSHTAGLVREAPAFEPFTIQPDADVVRSGYPKALLTPPGEKYAYSNLGYFALAEIISRVSGKPWSEFIHDRVFSPAGMTVTRTTTTAPLPGKAKGYVGNDALTPAPDWTAIRPSGAFLSNVEDLARWEAVLHTDKVLREATRKQMWTAMTLTNGSSAGYGFGWQVGPLVGRPAIYHGGSLPGFRSFYVRFVDDGMTVIVLTNSDDADLPAMALGIARRYVDAAAPSASR